jgi:hypothetical protein
MPTARTKQAATKGSTTAQLSPARSTPKARPYASDGAREDSNESRAGDRTPRAIQAKARSTPACQTVAAKPIAAVAAAVPM